MDGGVGTLRRDVIIGQLINFNPTNVLKLHI